MFFYGTLMRGGGLRQRVGIDPLISYVSGATTRGALFDLGPYPAAIRGDGTLMGELYTIVNPDELLARVDAIEGYVPGNRRESQYVREAVSVTVDPGSHTLAWIYFYERPLGDARWIPAGDYRSHVGRRPGTLL